MSYRSARHCGHQLDVLLDLVDGVAVTSPIVSGVLSYHHSHNMTVGGSKGSISGNHAMGPADLLLAVGTRAVCQSGICSSTGWPTAPGAPSSCSTTGRMGAISTLQRDQYGQGCEHATWDHVPVDYVAWARSVAGVAAFWGARAPLTSPTPRRIPAVRRPFPTARACLLGGRPSRWPRCLGALERRQLGGGHAGRAPRDRLVSPFSIAVGPSTAQTNE
jgi:hypothetical protein